MTSGACGRARADIGAISVTDCEEARFIVPVGRCSGIAGRWVGSLGACGTWTGGAAAFIGPGAMLGGFSRKSVRS